MKPNAFQVFELDYKGNLRPDGEPKATLEEAEESIRIPADLMGSVTYVILPLYTNKRIKQVKKV